jgi:hypothetical protein
VTNETGTGAWLVVSVSTAGGAASLRVLVWRKLRSLGALYLQQPVCLLPATADVARDVRRLAGRVRQGGGTARVLPVAFTDPAAEQAVITELNAARDAEYAEVPGRLPGLHRELAREQARGRAADAGAGESGAGLDRFRAWPAKIGARDYSAALAASGNAALDAGTSGPAPATGPGQPRLRAVDGP